MAMARVFLEKHAYTTCWNDDFYQWMHPICKLVHKGHMEGILYAFIENCVVLTTKKGGKGAEPTQSYERISANGHLVDELKRALKALTYRATDEAPFSDPDFVRARTGCSTSATTAYTRTARNGSCFRYCPTPMTRRWATRSNG